MSNFNIFRNAVIRNDTSCRHDTNNGYAVVWDENSNFKQYEEFSGLTTRVVWDQNYFAVATSGVVYIGPTTDQPPVDAGVYDTIKVSFRVEVGFNQTTPTTGRIQFQTNDDPIFDLDKSVDFPILADNSYNEYTIDMSQKKEWQGEVIRIRLYPFVDGAPGNIVHFKHIKVQSSINYSCDTIYNGPLCSKYSEYSHPCPWVGKGGSCLGSTVNDGITIIEGINDKLLININDYGFQSVTLKPVIGASLSSIARDIEDKLSNIGIGGYSGNKVEVEFNKLKIIADDTRDATSTVLVGDTLAARELGFYSTSGQLSSVCENGEDSASRYEPRGTRQLSRAEISNFYLIDSAETKSPVVLDPRRYAVQAGRTDFASVQRDQKIDSLGKTIIEFNNPITNNGIITSLSFSGDATSQTKFVFIRPKYNGDLHVYDEVLLGQTTGPFIDKVFEVSCSVKVRKGDLIGIYDARLAVGRIEQRPNVSYFISNSKLDIGSLVEKPVVFGKGEAGLRLFAHGQDKEIDAVLTVNFDQLELVEEISVFALEETRKEEINLTRTLGGGLNGGPYIETEVGVDKFGNPAPPLTDLGAVTDGIKYPLPGALSLHPSWLDSTVEPSDKFDQTEFSVTLDFAKGIPVFFSVDRVVIYFRDVNNVKFFSIEYPLTTNPEDTDRNWGFVTDTYDSVTLDGKLLEPDTHPLYTNPMQATVVEFQDSYQFLEYNSLDLEFSPTRSRSIRFRAKNFAFVDDPTKSTLSNFVLAPSPYILEIEAYAQSVPVASIADNFFFESSQDGVNFYNHRVVRDEGDVSARYLIGYPVQYLKIHISPQSRLQVNSVSASTSRSKIKIKTNSDDGLQVVSFAKNDYESYETITVTNTDVTPHNYFINIPKQHDPSERCLLWNTLSSLQSLQESEIGPAPSISKREEYYPREYNYALNAPAYVVDPFWLLNQNKQCYISYDHGSTWINRGSILCDYNSNTYLTSISPNIGLFLFTYILIDLGRVYDLDTVQTFSVAGDFVQFSGPLYSSRDVNDPSLLDLGNDFFGVKDDARWLMYRAFSKSEDSTQIAALSYINISLDVLSHRNRGFIPWVKATKLTNYVFGSAIANSCGEGWACAQAGFNNYYAVDLGDGYRITNLLLGPTATGALGSTSDVDKLSPGGAASAYGAVSKSNSNITYSNSTTSNPNKVVWGSFGAAPGDKSRWILLRSQGNHIDEVAVHIEDNNNSSKPSFGSELWWSSLLGQVRKDKFNFTEGSHSIAIDYDENQGPAIEEVELQQSLGIDTVLSKRDQLRLLIYVSDASQLDFNTGHIALGRNTTESNGGNSPLQGAEPDRVNYFRWNLSDLKELITTGWNEVFLPFTDNFRVGQPYISMNNILSMSGRSTSGRSRLRWLRFQFAGVENNSKFTINLNGIKIVRGDFLPSKFGNGLYLSGNEYAKFPLHNFDVYRGTIEFFLNADWTKSPGCNTCDDPKDHTIFRFFNSDGYVLACFMTGEGLRVYVSDGTTHYYQTDNNSLESIFVGVDTHVAVSWDFLGRESSDAIRIYINGNLSSSFPSSSFDPSFITPNPNVVLMLGGIGWDGAIIPFSDAVGGVVHNIKVFNYPVFNFEKSIVNIRANQTRASDDLIEISLDGINFYSSYDYGTNLPALVRNVAPGQSFDVYVRKKAPNGNFSEISSSSTGFLEIIKAIAG